ncbi:MAG: hypothetical protein BWZ01_03028 [Deltaproteobacteria bacterium ADurb.BinA179]|nr:MAG: hypothetical protein BWZ01_03028 [Deltaproteobacteria bacterium ADurb.BinA179]
MKINGVRPENPLGAEEAPGADPVARHIRAIFPHLHLKGLPIVLIIVYPPGLCILSLSARACHDSLIIMLPHLGQRICRQGIPA